MEVEPLFDPIILPLDEKLRVQRLEHANNCMMDLPIDKEYTIHIQEGVPDRRDIQNRLMWVFHKITSEFTGESVKYVHGRLKLDVLLPMKLACLTKDGKSTVTSRRAVFELSILDRVPEREHKIGVAYDFVRSRGLPMRFFAEYLTHYQFIYGEQGLKLESNKLDMEYALYKEGQGADQQ